MKPCILCATDFTPAADEAASAALALAIRLHADLELVHVVGPFPERSAAVQESRLLSTYAGVARERLAGRIRELKHPLVQITGRTLEARGKKTVAGILEAAVAESCPEMVVIGTHGRSDFTLWPMGSFAETLAETLEAPVLVVHSARRLVEWGAGTSMLRVVAGVDLTNTCVPVLSALRTFRTAGNCSLTACHARHTPLPADSMLESLEASPASLRSLGEDRKKLRALIAQHVGTPLVQTDVEVALLRAATHIVSIAQDKKADVLVVGTHHRGTLAHLFHPSVSRQILRESTLNVLCVPVKPKPRAAGARR